MIANVAQSFTTGNDRLAFEYEGGSTLYHFSPKENGLSQHWNANVIFFADSEEHGLDILRRMLEFHITCANKYIEWSRSWEYRRVYALHYESERQSIINKCNDWVRAIDNGDVVLTEVPRHQFMKVAWADNDTIFM